MTDVLASQSAVIAVTSESAFGARASGAALIVVCNDVPPQAAGARASGAALIIVTYEYPVISKPHPYRIRCPWGFPYYIERTLI